MAFLLLRLLVLGVIAAAADDVHITWLTPPRGAAPCVVAEAGRMQRRPPPPLDAGDRPRAKPSRRRGEDDAANKQMGGEGSAEVTRKRNGTEGVYQCVVPRHGGRVLGYPAPWKFAYLEKQFTSHPENGTAQAGQPHVLSCDVSSAPAPAVTWLKNGEKLTDDHRLIFVGNQLLFTEVRKGDEGFYKCIAKNSYLNKSRYSNAAWLQVEESSPTPPSLVPLNDEVDVAAPRLSPVRLLCPVLGWPRPKISWEFTAPGSRTATLEAAAEVLDLTSLELDQEGIYKCLVDGHTHIYKTFNVTATEPVNITLPPVSKDAVRVSTVRFNCSATGRPAPVVTWYKDGKPLLLGGRVNLRSSIDGTRYELVVGDVDNDDAGIYQCFATSGNSIASSWALLSVSGAGADAPRNVRCWPLGAKTVLLHWDQPSADVMAYTVQAFKMKAFEDEKTAWQGGQPHTNREETVTVKEPLTPYAFQVRAYIRGEDRNVASDKSVPVHCQGQGVPINVTKLPNDVYSVSWRDFAAEAPGVAQWQLQYRNENGTEETHIPLDKDVLNYTLRLRPNENVEIRVLGSRTPDWLPQNLTRVPWTPTAGQDEAWPIVGEAPTNVLVRGVGARGFTASWRGPGPRAARACARPAGRAATCRDSLNNSVTFTGLEPDTEYEVEVQIRYPGKSIGGPFSIPVVVTTLSEASEHLKELKWKYVNASGVRVSWNAPPDKYTVMYSRELEAPIELWDSMDIVGNTALITGIDPSHNIFVMVKSVGDEPQAYSPVMTIPAYNKEKLQLRHAFTASGLRVWWEGAGPRVVTYSQNLTLAVDLWPAVTVAGSSVELRDLDPSAPTYVMVTAVGQDAHNDNVLTIHPRPPPAAQPSQRMLGVGIGVGVGACLLVALAVAAVCVWRRRKRHTTPRSRHLHGLTNDDDEEEAAEMKSVGGRLANGGGSRDAGEPLLNGHVHITENPQSKAPNGKMKKGLIPFDLSRFEDADTTLDTVLEADSSAATYDLLDTSRPPDDPPAPDSFGKLPDDNMNSELTHAFPSDNSKIPPTLQPNG